MEIKIRYKNGSLVRDEFYFNIGCINIEHNDKIGLYELKMFSPIRLLKTIPLDDKIVFVTMEDNE